MHVQWLLSIISYSPIAWDAVHLFYRLVIRERRLNECGIESLRQYEESLFPGASSFGRVIYADGCYVGDVWCYGIDEREEKMAMFSFLILEKKLWG